MSTGPPPRRYRFPARMGTTLVVVLAVLAGVMAAASSAGFAWVALRVNDVAADAQATAREARSLAAQQSRLLKLAQANRVEANEVACRRTERLTVALRAILHDAHADELAQHIPPARDDHGNVGPVACRRIALELVQPPPPAITPRLRHLRP